MRKWLAAALCVLALGSTEALAEPDSFGVGDGHNGPLTVAGSGTVINSYAPVTASLGVGTTSIPIGACVGDAACFTAGELVLVFQTTGLLPVPASGTQTAVELSTDPVGRWELARLSAVTPSTLELTAPLVHAYAANVTQVIRVPEYTSVNISSGRSITAPAWNGSTGGIVAFLANGVVTNSGQITTSGLGFRGGQYVNDTSGTNLCDRADEPFPEGAQKGEGIASSRYGSTQTGRGNVANGAGGGVCFKSGGGGGGNGGGGGLGGHSSDTDRDVGGLGGAPLTYSVFNHLTLGGGGGAGHGSDNTGVAGGNGGGAIFIRASQLMGSGIITASGSLGGASASDGGSGGGAGGSIYLRFVKTADCVSISATGGIGGNVNAIRVGPGGGGGGGRVLFQAAGGSCPIIATGAASGVQQDPSDASYGAQAGKDVLPTVISSGFVVPSVPTVVTPANGSATNNRRPLIMGTALAGADVIIYLDGNEVGRTTADASGDYAFDPPSDLADGPHTVQAVAEVLEVRSARSTLNNFTVDTSVPDTSIISGPSGRTREPNATFEFGSTEENATYECRVDGAADFTPCSRTVTFPNLAEGPHTVEVRARDAAGNVDASPATRTFRITSADLALLGSGCSATGRDSSLVLMGLGVFAALGLRRRRG